MAHKGRIRWDQAASAAANAHAQLPALVSRYYRQGRALLDRPPSPPDLHAFRRKTKRLRYTLELFRSCYGPGLERHLDAIRQMQNLLGDSHDCVTALRLSAKSLAGDGPRHQKVERFLRARSARLAAGFRKHWREEFDAPGRERARLAYLGRRSRGKK